MTTVWSGSTEWWEKTLQTFDVKDTPGRYVRITMTANNSHDNAWLGLFETEIYVNTSTRQETLGEDMVMEIINKFIVLAVVGAALLSAADLAAGENVPGIVNDGRRWWRDVDGKEMACFPNTVLKVGDTSYLYGEWCFEEENSGKNVLKCYSSKDLVRWKFENDVLTQEESHLINRGNVLYNPATKQYVYCYKYRRPMRFKGWKIGDGILAWATCSSPTGQFQVAHKDPRVGIVAGEAAMFQDDDGKAYLLADGTFEPKEGKRLNLYELSPDYCSIARRVCDLGTGHEAVSIHKTKASTGLSGRA